MVIDKDFRLSLPSEESPDSLGCDRCDFDGKPFCLKAGYQCMTRPSSYFILLKKG